MGDGSPEQEVEELRKRRKNWPEKIDKHFNKELDKILRMNQMAAEYPVAMNYAELMVELPWAEFSKDDLDETC